MGIYVGGFGALLVMVRFFLVFMRLYRIECIANGIFGWFERENLINTLASRFPYAPVNNDFNFPCGI